MGQFDIPPAESCGPDTTQESLSSWAGQSDGKLVSFNRCIVGLSFATGISLSARADACPPMGVSEKDDNRDPELEPYIKPRDPAETRKMVERWRATLPITRVERRKGRVIDVQAPGNSAPILDPDLMSPLTLDLFKDTASTTASSDCTEVGNNKGHWLVSIKRW